MDAENSIISKKNGAGDKLEALTNALREAIIFGRYRPRERLIEEELTEEFNTSRHALRNAFTELDHMGLVERRPNKGVVVRDFSIEEIEELYDMRALLQREAAMRISTPVSKTLLDEVRRINAEYYRVGQSGLKEESSRLNTQFHEVLNAACGNRFLHETINQFWLRTTPIHWFALGDTDHLARSHADHEKMIACLEVGDLEGYGNENNKHMLRALEAYRRVHFSKSDERRSGAFTGTQTNDNI